MNDENLIPNEKRSPKEVRENGRKGGIASGVARRKKKAFKEILDEEFSKMVSIKGSGKEVTRKEAVGLRLMQILMDTSTNERDFLRALEFARDTIGEAPVEKVEAAVVSDETVREIDEFLSNDER